MIGVNRDQSVGLLEKKEENLATTRARETMKSTFYTQDEELEIDTDERQRKRKNKSPYL